MYAIRSYYDAKDRPHPCAPTEFVIGSVFSGACRIGFLFRLRPPIFTDAAQVSKWRKLVFYVMKNVENRLFVVVGGPVFKPEVAAIARLLGCANHARIVGLSQLEFMPSVITSYSIHYTKLYEADDRRFHALHVVLLFRSLTVQE